MSRLITIAHRAGNDLATLRRAQDAGVDVIEVDVWLHRGRLEVRHTKSLGPVPFLWDRWKLEPAWKRQLTVHELLAHARPGTGLMFDLKGRAPGLPAALIEALAPHAAGRRLLVCGQNWELLAPFAGRPHFTVVHSIGRAEQLARIRPYLAPVENDAVSIHRRLLSPEVVRELRRHVSMIITWPVNDDAALAAVKALGVDAITSDDIALLERVRGRALEA